jgi:hypothetical protein
MPGELLINPTKILNILNIIITTPNLANLSEITSYDINLRFRYSSSNLHAKTTKANAFPLGIEYTKIAAEMAVQMDVSSPGDKNPPPGSSSPPIITQSDKETDLDKVDMIELPPTPRPQQFGHLTEPINFSYSSDPFIQDTPIPKQNLHAKTPYDPTRKRPLEGHVTSEYHYRTKRTYFIDKTPGTLILETKDLLVKATGLTKKYNKQTRLLDLIEIFREYTEKEKVLKTSNIIISQIASLEITTRRIESKAKELAQTAPKNRTIAQIASIDPKSTPISLKPEE